MKKLIAPSLALVFFAVSCEKNPPPQVSFPANNQLNHSAARELPVFNYHLYQDPTSGDYSCPTPKDDCSKIEPNPGLSLHPIDNAIRQGKVQHFFNSPNWTDKFPFLDDQ